jgi:CheY-like chemotaxis protein
MRVGLLLLGMALLAPRLGTAQSLQPVDPYTSEYEKSPPAYNAVTRQWAEKEMREKAEQLALRISIPGATAEIPDPGEALAAAAALERASKAAYSERDYQNLGIAALILLAGGLVVRRLAPLLGEYLNARYNPWLSLAVANSSANILAEEKTFAEFIAAFRIGPEIPAPLPGATGRNRKAIDPLREFFAGMPKQLMALRNLLQQVRPAADPALGKKSIEDLRREIGLLKSMAGLPDVLPIWQMACALDGLLTQLAGKAQNVTLSTLRTIAQALDLLELLAVPGLKRDLAVDPPIRLLAVDDDPISRHAISFALKKALNQPDLAPNADAALPLTRENLYDVIFLDVQMPGMDGFELCSKIHEGGLNQKTPVVFVTCQSDFEARAKSTLAGGHDLMGKPFLTFEITLKALTLVLRGRLERATGKTSAAAIPAIAAKSEVAKATPVVEIPAPTPAKPEEPAGRKRKNKSQLKRERAQKKRGTKTKAAVTEVKAEIMKEKSIASPALNGAAKPASESSLTTDYIRHQFQELTTLSPESGDREELLDQLCLGIHSLTSEADRKDLSPAFRLSTALQGLLKKVLDDPKRATSSTVQTAGAALGLLEELRSTKARPDLVNPPVRILIVDDDPLARRAITGAVQLSFAKPESVESGEAAVALATEKQFDVIFLDVRMPGMDGFMACERIRATPLNAQSAIVFVTSHSDSELQKASPFAGGKGYIPKPALAVEVTLTALTFAIGNRLAKMKEGQANPAKETNPAASAKASEPTKAEAKALETAKRDTKKDLAKNSKAKPAKKDRKPQEVCS